MDILNQVDTSFLVTLSVILLIFCVFYFVAAKRQDRAMKKVEESQKLAIRKVEDSIKRQEQGNHQLGLILNEIRRSNRLLGELANIDPADEEFAEPQNAAPASFAASASQSADPAADSQFKLYVGNIDYTATEAELGSHFAQFGKVEFVNIPVNRYTGKARGFGFVTFLSKEDAERAMSLHGSEFKGRQIQVNFAKERDIA